MKYVYWAIIAGLCYLLLRIDACSTPAKTVMDTTYVTHRDTVREHVPVPFRVKGETIRVVSPGKVVYVDRPAHVDTATILSAFYSKVYYTDTARMKWGSIFIRDTLTQNRIVGRSVMTDFSLPTITKTVTRTEAPRRMLFIGPDIGFGIGVSAAYKTKTDHLFGLGYMLTPHGGILDLSYKWKISIR
jgi:hypothetical protein